MIQLTTLAKSKYYIYIYIYTENIDQKMTLLWLWCKLGHSKMYIADTIADSWIDRATTKINTSAVAKVRTLAELRILQDI